MSLDADWMGLYHTALADKEELQRQVDALQAERAQTLHRLRNWFACLLLARKVSKNLLKEMKDFLTQQLSKS